MSVNAILRVVKGPREGDEIKLPSGRRTSVGRKAENDIAIPDGHMSRRHFALEVTETEVILTDLNSSHGVTVGGNRIAEAAALKSGDVIGAGATEFSIEITPKIDATPPAKSSSDTVVSEPKGRPASSEPPAPAPAVEAPASEPAEKSPQEDSWGEPSVSQGDAEVSHSSTGEQNAAASEPSTDELPKQPTKPDSHDWDEMWSSHPSGSLSANESPSEEGPPSGPTPTPSTPEQADEPESEAGPEPSPESRPEPSPESDDDDWW